MTDQYESMVSQIECLRIGLDKLKVEREDLRAHCFCLAREREAATAGLDSALACVEQLRRERAEVVAIADERGSEIEWCSQQLGQARRDLAETRERLEYHMRRASIMASAGSY